MNRRQFLTAISGGLIAVAGCTQTETEIPGLEPERELWSFQSIDQQRISTTPVVRDGRVYVGSNDHNVYALAADTGREIWQFETGDEVKSSPTIADETLYIGSLDNHLYALGLDGTERWSVETGDEVHASPTVTANQVLIGSRDSHLYTLESDRGESIWRTYIGGTVLSKPTVDGEQAEASPFKPGSKR